MSWKLHFLLNDKHFVDTSILMCAHDASAGEKHERAKILVESCGAIEPVS